MVLWVLCFEFGSWDLGLTTPGLPGVSHTGFISVTSQGHELLFAGGTGHHCWGRVTMSWLQLLGAVALF